MEKKESAFSCLSFNSSFCFEPAYLLHLITQEARVIYYYTLKNKEISILLCLKELPVYSLV